MIIKINLNKGFGIIEALVGITIAALLLVAFTTLIWQTIRINSANTKDIKAIMYLQELIEIVKDLERSNPSEIFADYYPDPYICHPFISENKWILNDGEEPSLENTFTRSMKIENVSRDANNIEEIYNRINNDPKTKKITATISWNNGFQDRTMNLETYVYDYTE